MKTSIYHLAVVAITAAGIASLSCKPKPTAETVEYPISTNPGTSYSQAEVVTPNASPPPVTNGRSTTLSSSGSDSVTRDNSYTGGGSLTNHGQRSDALTPGNSYEPAPTNMPPTNMPPATAPGTIP